MLAPTDAVAVTAILKAGGGPEAMVVIMEGEALLNDASAVTLYTGGRRWLVWAVTPSGWSLRRAHGFLTPSASLSLAPPLPAVFLHILLSTNESGGAIPSVTSELWPIVRDILK